MNCECGKPITSQLTGNKCATCFFKKEPVKGDISEPIVSIPEVSIEEPLVKLGQGKEGKDKNDPIHEPSKSSETKIPGVKYCQSCIERYNALKLATREWRPDYFICDECFEPLLNNILNLNENEIVRVKTANLNNSSPLLEQIYNLLEIPPNLRFSRSDDVLKSRNDIFNHHATALVNKDITEISKQIEELSIILFQVKVAIEPRQDYINRVKYAEREKAGLKGLEKSEKEYTKGPSKVKQSKDEKMAKQLGMTLEKYLEMAKAAKKSEFEKIVNS